MDTKILPLTLCPEVTAKVQPPIQPINHELCVPFVAEPLVKPLEIKKIQKVLYDNNAIELVEKYLGKECIRFDYKTAIDRFNKTAYDRNMLSTLIDTDISKIDTGTDDNFIPIEEQKDDEPNE